jgi:hypothetical protein
MTLPTSDLRKLPAKAAAADRQPSESIDQFIPRDLEGASVLQIGNSENLSCLDDGRRNIGKTVTIADADVLDAQELGPFDYVLCWDLPYRDKNIAGIIHRLIGSTRRKIVIRIPGPSARSALNFETASGADSAGLWRRFCGMLRDAVLPAISRGRVSPDDRKAWKWAEDLLYVQRRDIDHFELIGPDRSGRYTLAIFIRRLRNLALVSGPAGVGKSELVRRLISGRAEPSHLFEFDVTGCDVLSADRLDEHPELKSDSLILEYNIHRPYIHDLKTYEDDPAMTIMRTAEKKTVHVLICSKDVLIGRLLSRRGSQSHLARRLEDYSRPSGLKELYEQWIAYCKGNGWTMKYVDVTSEIKLISEDEAKHVVSFQESNS